MVGEPTELSVVHHQTSDELSAYERLLGDAMNGDPTLGPPEADLLTAEVGGWAQPVAT